MEKYGLLTKVCIFFVILTATAISSHAQTFTNIFTFNYTEGANPNGTLVQATDGNLYGTTWAGGHGYGVFFVIDSGTVTPLHSFESSDGAFPNSGLVQTSNGDFYGTTHGGGAHGYGTVFEITSAGSVTTLHSFRSSDGAQPWAGLVQGTDGNFYGTTYAGGAHNYGTVFKITPSGGLTTLHSFSSTDGAYPNAGLVQATSGNFYGTTDNGGTYNYGTVFEITPTGKLTTLHSFDYSDGANPNASLVASDGNFYGTTWEGGADGYGTVFEMTPAGALTTLQSFNWSDGAMPYSEGLAQGTDGNFYGTVQTSSNYDCGTIYEITPGGTLTTLHNFDYTDGCGADSGLTQATNGTFYGTSWSGGSGYGTVFTLSLGLAPFVQTRPSMGVVGTDVTVLGNNLTGTSKVSFNGIEAHYKVISATEIKTRVPSDATTGALTVTTPSGTLSSATFFVMPKLMSFTPVEDPVGTQVQITGVGLAQATSASLNGAASEFTVDSDKKVTVPTSPAASGQDQELSSAAIPKPAKRLIGDYSYSSRTQTPPYTSEQIPYAKLTHIIHFCLGFYSDGSLYIAPDPNGLLEPNLLTKAHANGVKVQIGVCGPFNDFDGSPNAMATLIGNVEMFVKEHGYDGVDIDWEYPTMAETNNFYSLMAGLRAALPSPTYLISADVPPWGNGGNGYAIPQVDRLVDFFNIMMYECATSGEPDGQLNAEIFWDWNNPDPWECQPGGSANEAVDIFLQEGVAPSQLNMGTPFYGYLYADVSELFGDCPPADLTKDGGCKGISAHNYGTFFKQRINQKGWHTYYDPIALVPYMLRVDGTPGFITYDDEISTYTRVWYSDWQWNLGGVFMWSIDADYDGQTQDLLDQAYAASLPPGN
jgi:uncharacterized repeat protein (TIGR03803 family)